MNTMLLSGLVKAYVESTPPVREIASPLLPYYVSENSYESIAF